jgi:Fe-S-cluster containining protein
MDTEGAIIHGSEHTTDWAGIDSPSARVPTAKERRMNDEASIPDFQCTRCGKCCVEGASRLSASEADLDMWARDAPHVLAHVAVRTVEGVPRGDLWISPRTRRDTVRCPWIRKYPNRGHYYCRIYEVRPEVCRRYPTSREHALITDCPGIAAPSSSGTKAASAPRSRDKAHRRR